MIERLLVAQERHGVATMRVAIHKRHLEDEIQIEARKVRCEGTTKTAGGGEHLLSGQDKSLPKEEERKGIVTACQKKFLRGTLAWCTSAKLSLLAAAPLGVESEHPDARTNSSSSGKWHNNRIELEVVYTADRRS